MTIDESWNKFLAKLGVGGIAAFLVYQLSMNMQQTVHSTGAMLTIHKEHNERALEQTDRLLRQLVNVNVQQCINATTVPAKKDACFVAINNAPVRNPQ